MAFIFFAGVITGFVGPTRLRAFGVGEAPGAEGGGMGMPPISGALGTAEDRSGVSEGANGGELDAENEGATGIRGMLFVPNDAAVGREFLAELRRDEELMRLGGPSTSTVILVVSSICGALKLSNRALAAPILLALE